MLTIIPKDIFTTLNSVNKLLHIKTDNRTFYEFYQEIMKIITATKDYHISIYSVNTPKGIQFGE
jgi:hypothetical protein